MRIRKVIQEQIPIGGNQSNTKSVDCIGPGEFMIRVVVVRFHCHTTQKPKHL